MKVIHYESIEAKAVDLPGASGVSVRIPISAGDGAPGFTMRVFTIEPGGNTPFHRHDYEHEIVILKGGGELRLPEESVSVNVGCVVFVPPGEWHGFKADATTGMEMVCLVPNRAYDASSTVETGPVNRMEG